MSSSNGIYKGSESGDQLPPIHEQNSAEDTTHLQIDDTVSQMKTRRRSPTRWALPGMTQNKDNDSLGQTAQENGHIHRNYSSHFDQSDSTNPPVLPPRRRMSDDPMARREKPPALPPRNSASRTEGLSSGFVNARKGGFSGNLSKWKQEREEVSRTGRCAIVPPPLQEEKESAQETLSLLQFVKKYSDSLPAQISVITEGHYGSNDRQTLGNHEKLIISFVKTKKVLSILTSTQLKFTLPLGSAVQLSLLYNPDGNEDKARDGYTFQSVGELVKKSPRLPKVICATKSYKGDGLKSTVYENELLVVENYNDQTKKLQVTSLSKNPMHKFLPLQCDGGFTTKPSSVRMYVSDINNYVAIGTIQHALLDMSEVTFMSADSQVDKSLYGVVQLSCFVIERSLIGTRLAEEGVSSAESKVFEISVNDNLSDVEVMVMQTNLTVKHSPLPSLDVQLESWYQKESTASSTTQRLFDDYVRHGYEREGLTINAAFNVYEELLDPKPPLPPPKTTVSPYSVKDLLQHKQIRVDDLDEADSGTSSKDPDEQISLSSSPSNESDVQDDYRMHTTSDGVSVTKSELEMTIRSVLSEVMSEKQKTVPERGGTDYYTSMDLNEGIRVLRVAKW